jgi:hypothetical protein
LNGSTSSFWCTGIIIEAAQGFYFITGFPTRLIQWMLENTQACKENRLLFYYWRIWWLDETPLPQWYFELKALYLSGF